MSTTSGNTDHPRAGEQRPTRLTAFVHRWHAAFVDIQDSVLSGRRRQDAHRDDRRAPGRAPAGHLTQSAAGYSRERELVPRTEELAQALAVMCDRLLKKLDVGQVKAAEIRFVVHRDEHANYPRLEPGRLTGDGELVLELRRLIVQSGGAIADVARALESRGADLDETARELIRDELAVLEVDLATLNAQLVDAFDWDGEARSLLAEEAGPFGDRTGDENDEDE